MREHQEAAFRLAYLILGDAAEADDAAQEAFIRAYRALDRYDPARPFRPWLLSITANAARNRLRSAARYLAALQRLVNLNPAGAAGPGNDPAPTVASKQRGAMLWQAVRRLGPADQEVIYLRYFMELSEAETAEALNVAPGTVKSRLHRALARLRTLVDREYKPLREMAKP
jgi:RNA polymerase sigma-70 factor (ECF subfamily)